MTLPLLRPGLAAAFLLGFVESMADFGVLWCSRQLRGALDEDLLRGGRRLARPSRAAVLALVLLVFTLAAFWAQQRWLGRASYTTVTGKGDAGLPVPLRGPALAVLRHRASLGGCAGHLRHHLRRRLRESVGATTGFARSFPRRLLGGDGSRGLHFTGAAWPSLTTLIIDRRRAAHRGDRPAHRVAPRARTSPASALRVRHAAQLRHPRHRGRHQLHPRLQRAADRAHRHRAILVICFVFRNMPVGVRAGIATLAQIDKSLDGSHTGARSATTIRRVVLPLRPAIIAALVYSFVRAVSAVIFLVTAEYNMARHRRPGGGRRVRARHRVFLRADRHHAGRDRPDPARRRRAQARAARGRRDAGNRLMVEFRTSPSATAPSRRWTTSRFASSPERSRRCSARRAAARPPRCASSPDWRW